MEKKNRSYKFTLEIKPKHVTEEDLDAKKFTELINNFLLPLKAALACYRLFYTIWKSGQMKGNIYYLELILNHEIETETLKLYAMLSLIGVHKDLYYLEETFPFILSQKKLFG
jgi:hypothetical protein